jgi:acyl-CoA thioester hydrolase
MSQQLEPIVYTAQLPVRFADLDPFGHVNASHYLDYVVSSRFLYAREHLGITAEALMSRKIGFYLAQASSEFLRPIIGVQTVTVSSWVEKIEGAKLHVPYELHLDENRLLASKGQLLFLVIDLATNKPQPCPDWAREWFFAPPPRP